MEGTYEFGIRNYENPIVCVQDCIKIARSDVDFNL